MYATKNGITKKIQKQEKYLYEEMGWLVTRDANEPYDRYDYDDVNAMGNCLQPITINGEVFNGYSSFSCINTKTYVEEPERTLDGSIPNINDYDTFIVPRVKISFDYMEIQDFRRFLKAIAPNEFPVSYYDYETDKIVTYNMYCEPREMAKIYNRGYEILAITGQEISLIGTLNDVDYLNITYYDNETYIDENTQETKYYLFGQKQMIYGNYYSIDSGNAYAHNNGDEGYTYKMLKWNTKADGSGIDYAFNETLIATENLDLYAQWQSFLTTYIITYNLNGGINNINNPTTYNYDSATITLLNPTHNDNEKTFAGWYEDFDFQTPITTIPHNSTGNLTLYAKWV